MDATFIRMSDFQCGPRRAAEDHRLDPVAREIARRHGRASAMQAKRQQRLHQRLIDYSFRHAQEASRTGLPIIRPLFLVDPKAPQAWTNWWTYLYGRDILVSPLWEKGRRTQEVYLPSGDKWRDAWIPERVYQGGQTITVRAELHQVPLFIRAGSGVKLGDLNVEWNESRAVAERKPDLKALDEELKLWFAKRSVAPHR